MSRKDARRRSTPTDQVPRSAKLWDADTIRAVMGCGFELSVEPLSIPSKHQTLGWQR